MNAAVAGGVSGVKGEFRIDDSFVPRDFDAADWPTVEAKFRQLLERPIRTTTDLEKWWVDRSELESALSEARADRYIAMTCRTEDAEARKAFLYFVEEIEPKTKPLVFALNRRHVEAAQRKALDRARYGVLDRDTEMEVKLFRAENVPLETELEKLDQQYQETCGRMTCTFDGREQTLPQMNRYLEETDRGVRETAWRAIFGRRLQDVEPINAIFDRMIVLRDQIAKNAGFANFRDYMFAKLHRFDYEPKQCEMFHDAVEKIVVPVLRRLNARRKEALRVSPLRPWDLAVDVKGRAPLRPFEGAEQLVDRTERAFNRLNPSLGEMFARLRAPGCLDLDSRPGKAPGGYQYQRDRTRRPFIFMNAAGLQRDVETLLHEGGHAFHSMLCDHEPLLHYRHAPMEYAEVASISMEYLCFPFLDEFYSATDADRARRSRLETMTTLFAWIATIDAFQHWLYTHPGHSRAERSAFWMALNQRFGPAVDWTGLEPFFRDGWQRQLHLFGVPFYYIEYAIAEIGALQLWQKGRTDPKAAVESYRKGLSLGGSKPLPELFAAAAVKFDFGAEMLGSLMKDVERELERLPV